MDAKLFHQPELIPLQSKDMRVQHPEVESIRNDLDPPRDYLIWSLINFVYINPCCLAMPALCWSIKARERLQRGDVEGARSLGRKACWMNGILTAVFIVLFITSIITFWISYRAVILMAAALLQNLFGNGNGTGDSGT